MPEFPIVDLSSKKITDIEGVLREQWETLCTVITPTGMCGNRALDIEDPIRICSLHQSVVIGQALRRLKKQLDSAIADDEKRAREAEEASNAGSTEEDPGEIEPGPGVP
jgi:hypothetical protein